MKGSIEVANRRRPFFFTINHKQDVEFEEYHPFPSVINKI